jgi:hypothetical protein
MVEVRAHGCPAAARRKAAGLQDQDGTSRIAGPG